MNKIKENLLYVFGLTILYMIWLTPGYWNLGFGIINTLFLTIVLKKFKSVRRDGFLRILWLLSFGLGIFMAIRSFEFVRFLSWVAIGVINVLLVAIARKPTAKLDIGRILNTLMHVPRNGWSSLKEGLATILGIKQRVSENGWQKVVVGILLSIPLLLIFGGLFYSADPIFAKLVDQVKWPKIDINIKTWWNFWTSVIFFGVVGGILRNRLAERVKTTKWLKEITETNVAVLILELLFVVFSAIQVRYFGATVEDFRRLGIVFSEYTRSGYGQMIVASLLAYGIVLRLEYSLRSQRRLGVNQQRLTYGLVWLMIIEILIFIVAATKRNYLYQSVYGYTEIRLLGFALSLWLVVMVGVVAYKVWQRKSGDFFVRSLVIVTATGILLLNVWNIDGTIVRTRPAKLDSGIDYWYMSTLSDDAWYGWEGVISNIEKESEAGINVEKYYRNRAMLFNLRRKLEYYHKTVSENNWHNLGSYNYATAKSFEYLKKNERRIDRLIDKLETQTQELSYKNCVEDVYQVLRRDFEGKVWREGDSMVLKTGVEMGPSEEAVMFNKVYTAARNNGMKWSWKMDWIVENKRSMKIYKISCTE